jgi:hypothetical protein
MAAGLVAVAACKSEPPQYNGLGPYNVKRTKLKDAGGRCEPTDMPDGRKGMWCFGQPPLTVAGKKADIDLYFLGTEPDAPVIEIQLQIKGCNEGDLTLWIRRRFGAPDEDRGRWASWSNAAIFLIAELPSSPGRCLLRVLPASEKPEFDRLREQLLAKPAPT